jgi:hypothetical protein
VVVAGDVLRWIRGKKKAGLSLGRICDRERLGGKWICRVEEGWSDVLGEGREAVRGRRRGDMMDDGMSRVRR